jgi:hypothetical protein
VGQRAGDLQGQVDGAVGVVADVGDVDEAAAAGVDQAVAFARQAALVVAVVAEVVGREHVGLLEEGHGDGSDLGLEVLAEGAAGPQLLRGLEVRQVGRIEALGGDLRGVAQGERDLAAVGPQGRVPARRAGGAEREQ